MKISRRRESNKGPQQKPQAFTWAFVLPAECGLGYRVPLPLAPVAPMKHLALIVALAAFSTTSPPEPSALTGYKCGD